MPSSQEVAEIVNEYFNSCVHSLLILYSDKFDSGGCRWVANLCGVASVGLVTFEFAITFGREVSLVWQDGKINGASVMLLSNMVAG